MYFFMFWKKIIYFCFSMWMCRGKYLWFHLWNLDLEEGMLLLMKTVRWARHLLKMTWIHGQPGHTDLVLYHYYLSVHAFLCKFIPSYNMFSWILWLHCVIVYFWMYYSLLILNATQTLWLCNCFFCSSCYWVIASTDVSSTCYKFRLCSCSCHIRWIWWL